MGKFKQNIVFLAIGVLTLLLVSTAKAPEIPPVPMNVNGYVFIHTIEGQNVTAPAGLQIFAKVGTETLPLVEGSKDVTDENGYYSIGIAGPEEGTPIDIWVEHVNVTRIILQYYTVVEQNLTVIDTESPSIKNLYPEPQSTIQANKPTWINATVTDNLAVDSSTIKLTLNETELTPTYVPETGQLYYQTGPLTEGLYNVKLAVKDIAGNTAIEIWNFTVAVFVPPTINVIYPTAAKPIYTQSGRTIQITYNYTEESPKNATIEVYNLTHTVATATITELAGGTDIQRTDSITIPDGTTDGTYSLNVTMFNTYGLSETATQTSAIIVDNTAPTITNVSQNPPKDNVQPDQPVKVSVNVTDKSGVKNVTLCYTNDTVSYKVPMNYNSTSGLWEATIPGYPLNTHVTYYIEAYDNAENYAVNNNNGQYFIYTVIPEFSNALIILLMLLALTAIATMMKWKKGLFH